ncbi:MULTISPECIES: cyanophycinase [Rufibacter]|uniref:Cyanophycinase n=1 Tax=Rufibacter quisquiliarum TaxID=1549639 RepID=A0A839GHP1_9BACT|nr:MULTISPECIES: cyanophycinase [Rufibacter]MBA9078402.1 cyanophycinase [Rufibacter quisquiliarum]
MQEPKGTLIALGGGDDDVLIELIKSELCSPDSHIEVITTATLEPLESGQAYKEAFEELGCRNVRFMHIDEANAADKPENLTRIGNAEVIFFTGGNQLRLKEFLGGTQLHRLMQERYLQDEITISGTSAGAAAMSTRMIYEGYGYYSLLKGEVKTTDGLSFISNVFLDTHFTERGRFGRLAHAVSKRPEFVGIGLGEETGIIIKQNRHVEVFGSGVITIIDGAHVRYSNLDEVEEGEPIAIENLTMHLLVEGHEYCLQDRSFRKVSQQRKKAKTK